LLLDRSLLKSGVSPALLSPLDRLAYVGTGASGPGGEHAMIVAGEGKSPSIAHLLQLAKTADIARPNDIIHDVHSAIQRFHIYGA
jgi:hypothetical protein